MYEYDLCIAAKRVSRYSVWVFGLGQGFPDPILWGWSLLRSWLSHRNICLIIKKEPEGFKGWVRPKLSQNGVIPNNLIGDHIYCPLLATIQNPFCHTVSLKLHMLCPIFSWHTRLIPLYFSLEKAMSYLFYLCLTPWALRLEPIRNGICLGIGKNYF